MFAVLLSFIPVGSTSDSNPVSSSSVRHRIHDAYNLTYLNETDLELLDEIGGGRFAQVYRARLSNGRIVAAKRLKPLESWRLKREVKAMSLLQGVPNVVEFIGLYGDDFSPVIVTEFAPSEPFGFVVLEELRWAVYSVLAALNGTHSLGLFHRDVKWQNMLVSFRKRSLKLVDWGLAEPILPPRKLPYRVGTTSYKAPELLMGVRYYGAEVDVWAAGVAMAELMFGCPTFFPAADDEEVLARQTRVFGNERMGALARGYECDVHLPFHREAGFVEFALPHTRHLFTRESLDLLGRLLTPEREARATAAEALAHEFFRDQADVSE
jgi:serine/threonine protein kinase